MSHLHFPSQQDVGHSSTLNLDKGRNTLHKPPTQLFKPNFPQLLRLLGVVQCCPQKTSNQINQKKHRAGRFISGETGKKILEEFISGSIPHGKVS